MLNRILGAVVGVVVAVVVVTISQTVSHLVFPPPPDLNWADAAAVRAYMQQMSVLAFLSVILGYAAAAFVGGWLANLVARQQGWQSWVPAGFVVLGTIYTVSQLPHPVWYPATAILAILGAGLLGGRMGPAKADQSSTTT